MRSPVVEEIFVHHLPQCAWLVSWGKVSCVSHKNKDQISVIFVPSVVGTCEFTPNSFLLCLPFFKVLPLKRVQVSKNSWSINYKIVLAIIDKHSEAVNRIQNPSQSHFCTFRKISRKAVINLAVSFFEVEPIRNPKIFLLIL